MVQAVSPLKTITAIQVDNACREGKRVTGFAPALHRRVRLMGVDLRGSSKRLYRASLWDRRHFAGWWDVDAETIRVEERKEDGHGALREL